MNSPTILWRDSTTEFELTSGAPQGQGWAVEVSADGTNWGSPEARSSLLRALLSDGDLVQWDSNGNRVITLQVLLKAPSSTVLAQGEAALDRMLYRRTELEWTPPDLLGVVPTVWDVETSERTQVYDAGWDLDENRFERRLAFQMTCLPHGRSKHKRVVTAPISGAATTVIDSGSAVGSWSAPSSGTTTPTVVSGRVRTTRADSGYLTLRRNASFDVTGKGYVGIDWFSSVSTAFLAFDLSGVRVSEVRREVLGGGLNRSWLPIPATTPTTVTSVVMSVLTGSTTGGYIEVDQVVTADALPTFGTARQKALGLATPGSVRTQTDLEVVGTAALGFVLLHTGPATGAPPPLRGWLTSAAGTANPALISGAYNDLSAGANVYRIPVDLVSQGEVELVASLYTNIVASNVTVKTDVQGYLGGAVVGPVQSVSMTTNYPVAQNPYLLSLGKFTFPPTRMGSAGYVQITLSQTSAGHIVYVDEAWNLSTGRGSALTVVEAGTQRRLKVEAPSQQNPQGALTIGTAADGSDARFPGVDFVRAWGNHHILTEGTAAFIAVTGVLDPTLTSSSYDRYHTHAATSGTE